MNIKKMQHCLCLRDFTEATVELYAVYKRLNIYNIYVYIYIFSYGYRPKIYLARLLPTEQRCSNKGTS